MPQPKLWTLVQTKDPRKPVYSTTVSRLTAGGRWVPESLPCPRCREAVRQVTPQVDDEGETRAFGAACQCGARLLIITD